MSLNKKIKPVHYFLLAFVCFIFFGGLRGYVIGKDIEDNGNIIIVKFIKKESLPKITKFYFGYYYIGKYYETSASGVKHSMFDSKNETEVKKNLKINHFYLAKFKSDYLERIIVNPSKEVSNSLAIKKAGFTHQ